MTILTLAGVLSLATQCAPGIAPESLLPLSHVESSWNTLAIGINHGPVVHPRTFGDAVMIARRYINAGYSVDLGIAQINSHNLHRLNMSIEDTFEPCRNFQAAERLLTENFARASQSYTGIEAINRTFSLYNSGNYTTGYRNNYVNKIWRAAARIVPQLSQGSTTNSTSQSTNNAVADAVKSGSTDNQNPDRLRSTPLQPKNPDWLVEPAPSRLIVF